MSDLTSLTKQQQASICQEIIRFHLLNAVISGQCELELHKTVSIDMVSPISLMAFWHDNPILADSKPDYQELVSTAIYQLKDSGVLPKETNHKFTYVIGHNCASDHSLALTAVLELESP